MMPRYLLDTNVCINLLRGRARRVFDRLRGLAVDDAGISCITLAELRCGAAKSARPAHQHELIAKFGE